MNQHLDITMTRRNRASEFTAENSLLLSHFAISVTLIKTLILKDPVNTFADVPLLPQIQKSLELLGFTKPTEIQAKVIPLLLNNNKNDIHAQAQTGTGKTLAFGIPLLHAINPSLKTVQALVVAPTRELVLQIYESLKEVSRDTGIIIEPIYGGMPINRQITNIKRGTHIIVGTPGRLNDHLRRKTLSLAQLKILVLDEADIMLDMGFKEEIDEILAYAPKNRQIWLFSATVGSGIEQLIKSHMKEVLSVKAVAKNSASTQVKQYFCVVPMRERVAAAARFIEAAPDFYGIIFCQTKSLTIEVMERLASKGFTVNCLQGDMKQTLRNQVIKGFKHKDFNILIATDVAARGIDVSGLTHVINFSIPNDHETYIHRIGRTGRAGKEGIAIMLVGPSEGYRVKRIEKATRSTIQEISVPTVATIITQKMSAISDFIEQSKQPKVQLSPVHTSLKELIASFTPEEIQNSFAVALEDKFFKDVMHEDIKPVPSTTGTFPQEICMELGRDMGFAEDEIRHYLYNTCKLSPQEVRKVRVINKKTFISIAESHLQDCLQAMRRTPITKTSHKIYLVEDIRHEDKGKRHHHQDRGYGNRFRERGERRMGRRHRRR